MKLEVGKRYVNREGAVVEILAYDKNTTTEYNYIGVDRTGLHAEANAPGSYRVDGRCGSGYEEYTLFKEYKEPIKVSGWVNIHSDGCLVFHPDKESIKAASCGRVTSVYVTGTEEVE